MSQVKEELVYMSMDFMHELKVARVETKGIMLCDRRVPLDPMGGHLKKHFLLPDFISVMKGCVKNDNAKIEIDEQVYVDRINGCMDRIIGWINR
jgi:hypothetical protein